MKRDDIKRIYRELQEKMEELEVAIYSDKDSYSMGVDYGEVLDYYQDRDSAEEGL